MNNAVAKVGIPNCVIPSLVESNNKKIIYHVWGNFIDHNKQNVVIEDAVDTFCLPGVNLAELGGDFEVWSLNKIIGSLGGGILWCKNKDIAKEARILRDQRFLKTYRRWFFRWIALRFPQFTSYWYEKSTDRTTSKSC